ncbi:hypothetical protein MHBO_003572 [Bonamia ostreae]|uniref:Uncharacterized protein n=1 Tax=Bonamia ostreae TaxID=126728 RepID=A0ABV2AQX3_9EUKA
MSQSEEDRGQHYVSCAIFTNCFKFYSTCHQQMYEQRRNIHLKEEETQKIHEVVLHEERMQVLPTGECSIHTKKVLVLFCSHCQAPACEK